MSQDIANETPLSGLTADEVAQRVARGDINRVARSRAANLAIVVRNLFTLFNALVAPAAVALFLLREFGDAIAVSGMALTNLVLGLVQEIRAKRHLDRLTLLAETRVRVRREGQVQVVPSGDVVRDDLLLLSAGDTVVADGPVLESRFLEVDEALLTGESDPVPRRSGEPLLSGSFCVAGEGSYRAEPHRRRLLRPRTPQAKRVPIATAAARFSAPSIASLSYSPPRPSFSVPVTLRSMSLARCALRLVEDDRGHHHVDGAARAGGDGHVRFCAGGRAHEPPRRPGAALDAVESMASIDTLCLDKTGTLTTNRLHLEKLLDVDEEMPEEAIRERLRLFASASLDRSSKGIAALRGTLARQRLNCTISSRSSRKIATVPCVYDNGTTQHVLVLGASEALDAFLDPKVGERRGVSPPVEDKRRRAESAARRRLARAFIRRGNRSYRAAAFAGSLEGFVCGRWPWRPWATSYVRKRGACWRNWRDRESRFRIHVRR